MIDSDRDVSCSNSGIGAKVRWALFLAAAVVLLALRFHLPDTRAESGGSLPSSRPVSITFTEAPLTTVLGEVARQSGIRVFSWVPDPEPTVTLTATQKAVDEVLQGVADVIGAILTVQPDEQVAVLSPRDPYYGISPPQGTNALRNSRCVYDFARSLDERTRADLLAGQEIPFEALTEEQQEKAAAFWSVKPGDWARFRKPEYQAAVSLRYRPKLLLLDANGAPLSGISYVNVVDANQHLAGWLRSERASGDAER